MASFVGKRVDMLLQQAPRQDLHTKSQCLCYLGSHFRVLLEPPGRLNDQEVCQ